MRRAGKPYLAVCSVFRNQAEYLEEWLEFHRLIGTERFFLYDNESTDESLEVLQPYVGAGIVVVHDWPTPPSVERGVPWDLIAAFNDCVQSHRHDARWIAFMDIDEFLFSPTGRPLPEVLADYESSPGVFVGRIDFAMSGHERKPAGLVIENYLQRRNTGVATDIKSIINPQRTVRCHNAHVFIYEDGTPVDERQRPIPGPPFSRDGITMTKLRINHYITKSRDEYRKKLQLWEAAGVRKVEMDHWRNTYKEHDDTITMYVPALRKALRSASRF